VRIYRPAKPPTQSGRGARDWVMEPEPAHRQQLDPLMGWAGYGDVERQVTLRFPSRDAAVRYAEQHNLAYTVIEEQRPAWKPKSYASNFAFNRPLNVYPH